VTTFAAFSFLIWCWLLTMRGRFWSPGPVLPIASPHDAPPVAIVVPARDEAPFVERALHSLLLQNYSGEFTVILVDDRSQDSTGMIARALGERRLSVLTGDERPPGWAGKLWALRQGIAQAGSPEFILLTDADIEHDPSHLASLVAAAQRADLDMVSEMVILNCDSWSERALIPAFVFFFQLLYPFEWVNNPLCGTAAAAGGTILIRRRALLRIGGIDAVKDALIDDVALAGAVKAGGRIFLGHSELARSIRPYPKVRDIWRMIARSAYAQLRFSPLLLIVTILAMTLVWLVPPFALLFGHGWTRFLGFVTSAIFTVAWVPTLQRYRLSLFRALLLPFIALFYMAATIGSAINHHRGRGVVWKGRAYAAGSS
jgi:hopene-associated glycosyltransferase HpnB